MRKIKWMFLVAVLLMATPYVSADDYSTDEGDIISDLGDGDYMRGSGHIFQVEGLGGGDYLTSDGALIESTGTGEYIKSGGEMWRDMGDSDHMESRR